MQQYHLHNRPNRELKQESEMADILKNGKFAVIAMCRDNEPYVVTLSYLHHLEDNDLVVKEKMLKSENNYSKMELLRLDIKQIHGKAGR